MNSKEVKPAIISILAKEGIHITEDNIKIWSCDSMLMKDVAIGCDYVKNKLNSNVICYTNKVNNIEYLEKAEGVKIFDADRLKELALKHNNYFLYDLLP